MTTIKEDYCSKEIYRLLIEKGFDGEIHTSYDEEGYTQASITLQMAMKWLREVHNICIVVSSSMFWGKYNVSIYKKGNDYPFGFDGDSLIPSYEEACEAAIKYCLENFI